MNPQPSRLISFLKQTDMGSSIHNSPLPSSSPLTSPTSSDIDDSGDELSFLSSDDDEDDDGEDLTDIAQHGTIEPSTNWPALHTIILDRILPLLPVRSVHHSRLVSSRFNRHISAPIFTHVQTLSNSSLSGIFLCDPHADRPTDYIPFAPSSVNSIPSPTLHFLPSYGSCHALASSRGLLCCSPHPHVDSRRYTICNPATQDYTLLPPSFQEHDGVALDLTPSINNLDNDYTLICTFLSDESTRGFAVFSSCNGQWWYSKQTMAGNAIELLSPHGVTTGGKAYWRTVEGSLLCYDPVGDCTTLLDVPEEAMSGWALWQIGELEGRLCCVTYSMEAGMVLVYMMRNGDWDMVRLVEMGVGVDVRPMVTGGRGREVVLWVEGGVWGCDVVTGERRLLCETKVAAAPEFLPYVSSFAFVKKFHENDYTIVEGNRTQSSFEKIPYTDLSTYAYILREEDSVQDIKHFNHSTFFCK